ncbi:MAG TPA: FkbM family methyltransferase [bacterium]|nr:FkbM family methyltransferase [bacterium]
MSELLSAELDALLARDPDAVRQWEQSVFDELTAPFGNALVVFGAGGLGRKTVAGLRRRGIEPLALADSNPALWGSTIDGVAVLPPAEAARRFRERATFVIAIWTGEATDTMVDRKQQLMNLGCTSVVPFVPLFWKYPDEFLPHFMWELPHRVIEQADLVRKAYGLLADDVSRREYISHLRLRMLSDFDGLAAPTAERIYFPHDLVVLSDREVLADCGAFDGDTIREFLEIAGDSFSRIVAFEPDPLNFPRLRDYVLSLPAATQRRIALFPKAVGSREETVRFLTLGTAGSAVSAEGTADVDVMPLDSLPSDIQPTFIKIDIEGTELEAIRGAAWLVEHARPLLAVCAYHKYDHLWQIPLLIHSYSSDYRFSLKTHLVDGWDLVCYAVPTARRRDSITSRVVALSEGQRQSG